MTQGQTRTFAFNRFPADITTWPGQDSNQRPNTIRQNLVKTKDDKKDMEIPQDNHIFRSILLLFY